MDVAVGSTHCLALTDDGEVHSWGSNDKLQHFDTLFSNKKQPKALPGLNAKHIVGISCGPGQVMHTTVSVDLSVLDPTEDGSTHGICFVFRASPGPRAQSGLLGSVCPLWWMCAL